MSSPRLGRVDRELLRDQAYRILRDAIVDGELAPGEILRDGGLAERVGLSRTPVREALARLAEEGLVESKPHAYTRVTPLVVADARDAYLVVRAMHELAVRIAAPVMGEHHVARMREANARFAAALDDHDVPAAIAADDELHDVPVRVAGNRAAAATITRYLPLIRRLERLRFGSLPGRRSIALHDRLINACAAHDAEAAVAATADIWATLGDQIEEMEA